MTTMVTSATALQATTRELDTLSKQLVEATSAIEQHEAHYRAFVEDFKVALFTACEETGKRLPAQDIRDAMANKRFRDDHAVVWQSLLINRAKRARLKGRLSDLREVVSAYRSLVSAEKTELDASSGPQPQWSSR
jgi:uncharacterized coiled-coil protein SlyX